MALDDKRGWRALVLGGSAMLAVALFAALRAVEGSLLRLHAPGQAGIGWSGLRRDVGTSFERWEEGKIALAVFAPLSPGRVIAVHVGISVVLLAVVVVVVRLLPDRFKGLWCRLFVVVAALAAVQILLTGAVGTGGCCRSTYSTALRWVTLAVQLGTFAVVVSFLVGHQAQIRRGFRAVRVVPASSRVAVGVGLLIFAIPQFGRIGSQIEDVIERTLDDHPRQLFFTAVAAVVHVAVMWVLVRIRRRRGGPVHALEWYKLIVFGGLLIAVGAAYNGLAKPGSGFGLIVIGAIVVVLGVLSGIPVAPERLDDPNLDLDPRWDARTLAAATALPSFGLAVAAARLSASQATVGDGSPWVRSGAFALVALAVAVVGATIIRRTGEPSAEATTVSQEPADAGTAALAEDRRRWSWALLGVGMVAFGTAPWWFVDLVDGDGWQSVGNLAVLLSVAPLVGLLLVAARFVGGELPSIKALRLVGINRVPVLTLGVLTILVLSTLDTASEYHDARVLRPEAGDGPIEGPEGDPSCVAGAYPETAAHREIAARFCAWLDDAAARSDDGPVDLVLVVASGGGVRAAAWTGRVLDCVFFVRDDSACSGGRGDDALDWADIFAFGGASGGSVGIASAVAEVLEKGGADSSTNWARDDMGADFLAPLAGRVLLQQIPMAVTGGYHDVDGAQELERAWSAAWSTTPARGGCEGPDLRDRAIADIGFLALAADCRNLVPLLLLNGTDVESGQRVNVSPLDGDAEPDSGPKLATGAPILTPASNDIVDVLCPGEDVPLFTAAFMSARFPLVTPSAHLPQRAEGHECDEDGEAIDVVDGGYYDNSGASQVLDVWSALAPMVAHVNTRPRGEGPQVRPTLLVIETGEGVPVAGTQRLPAPAPGEPQPVDVPQLQGPLRVGEMLRPLATALKARAGADYFRAQLSSSVAAFRAGSEAGRVVTFDLAEHPGRRLPLGWVLGGGSAEDIDRQLKLCINVEAAAQVGVTLTVDPDPCEPVDPPGDPCDPCPRRDGS